MLTEEIIFELSLEYCQGFIILDEIGKIIPPARNSERKCSRHHSLTVLRLLEPNK